MSLAANVKSGITILHSNVLKTQSWEKWRDQHNNDNKLIVKYDRALVLYSLYISPSIDSVIELLTSRRMMDGIHRFIVTYVLYVYIR